MRLRELLAAEFLGALVFLAVLAYAIAIEPFNLQVTENEFELLEGDQELKIVVIGDIQGAYYYGDYFRNAIQSVNDQNPDLIFIVGDIVEGEEKGYELIVELQNLKSRYGTYAILGNHDYRSWDCSQESYVYADKVEAKLESYGIEVLRNDNRIIKIRNQSFALVGVDDYWSCRGDYNKSVSGLKDIPKIILAHNYLSVENESLERSLVLSGHTHCGQVWIPPITEYILKSEDFGALRGGRHRLAGGELYITCGLTPGTIRLFTRPEISVLRVT
jgi:predicted MPP superfamily phosphohydrolase